MINKFKKLLFIPTIFISLFVFSSVKALTGVTYENIRECNVGDTINITCNGEFSEGSTDAAKLVKNESKVKGNNSIYCNSEGVSSFTCTETSGILWWKKTTNTHYSVKVRKSGDSTLGEKNTDDKSCKNVITNNLTMYEGDIIKCNSYDLVKSTSPFLKISNPDDTSEVTIEALSVGELYSGAALVMFEDEVRTILVMKRTDGTNPATDNSASDLDNKQRGANGAVTMDPSATEKASYTDATKGGAGAKGGTKIEPSIDMSKGMCQDFDICYNHIAEKGTFLTQMRSLNYVASCADSGSQYVAFCLDPGYINPPQCDKKSRYHANDTINMETTLGKKLYTLYKLYTGEFGGSPVSGNCSTTDYVCQATWQSAARLIVFSKEERANWSWSAGFTHSAAQKVWEDDTISGSVIPNARSIYNAVMSQYTKPEVAKTDNIGNISLEQIGDVRKSSTRFDVKYRLTIQGNVTDIHVDWEVRDEKGNILASVLEIQKIEDVKTDANGNKYLEFLVSGPINKDDCSSYLLTAKVKFNGGNDLRKILVLSNKTNSSMQRFLAFATGPSASDDDDRSKVSTKVNPGNTDCDDEPEPGPEPTPCQTTGDLTCAADTEENTTIIVNEGVPEGIDSVSWDEDQTDWEKCIIGYTDSQGNPYDIEVQEDYTAKEDHSDEETTLIDEDERDNVNGIMILPGSAKGYKMLEDISFCTISCKEKYEIVLPKNQSNVYKGTYFSFNIAGANPDNRDLSQYHALVGVKAERKCVTSGDETRGTGEASDVDYGEYEDRVKNLRQQQVDYMNAYEYLKAVYDTLANSEVREAYIKNQRSNGFEEELGSHYGDRKDKSTDPYADLKKEIDPNSDFIVKSHTFGVEIDEVYQYKLSSDAADAEIIKYNAGVGNTKDTFRKSSVTKKSKFITKDKNYYKAVPDYESGVFEEFPNSIAGADEEHSKSYDWEKDKDDGTKDEGTDRVVLTYKKGALTYINDAYDKMLESIAKKRDIALERVHALSRQITMQSSSIITCTKYLDNMGSTGKGYRFDPKITFTYDQENYMSMMGTSRLILASNAEPELTVDNYYADGASTAAEVFNEGNKGADSNSVTFNYFGAEGVGETTSAEYNEIGRAGTVSTFTCTNDVGGNDCYYRPATQFLTYPPDGIVTVDPTRENASYIETDGRVYPVTITTAEAKHEFHLTFEQIGQYFESSYLGRIMGGNGQKSGTMSGEARDDAVCYYDIVKEHIDSECITTAEEYCEGGNFSNLSAEQLDSCVRKLLEVKDDEGKLLCCAEAETAITYNQIATPATIDAYDIACPNGPKFCSGFYVVSEENRVTKYDQALVNDHGDLQFTVRTVSLSNLFPNTTDTSSTRGRNWTMEGTNRITEDVYANTCKGTDCQTHGMTINEIIRKIQNDGDSIYGGQPDYSCTLTPTCIKEIQKYNRDHESEGGLDNYNLGVNCDGGSCGISATEFYVGSKSYDYDDSFRKNMESWGCTCDEWKNEDQVKGIYKHS